MELPDERARMCEVRSLLLILLYVLSSVGAYTHLCACALVLGKKVGEKAWHSPIVLLNEDRKLKRSQVSLPHSCSGGVPLYAPLSN